MRKQPSRAFAAKVSAALSLLFLGSCVLVFDYGDYRDPTGGQAGSASGGGNGQGGGEEACDPGKEVACYSGPEGTESNEPCKVGTKTCDSDGKGYSACIGEVLPTVEVCFNQVDEDCNANRCSEPLWARRFGGAEDQEVTGAYFDIDNLFVVGAFTGTIEITPGKSVTRAMADGPTWYAARLGGNAEPMWITAGADTSKPSRALGVFGGDLGTSFYVGGYQGTSGVGSGEDGFVSRLLVDNGTIQETETIVFGGPQDDRIHAVTTDGNILHVAASFRDTVNVPGKSPITSRNGSADVVVLAYHMPTAVLWSLPFGGDGDDIPHDMAVRGQGSNLAITGAYRNVLYDAGMAQIAPDAGAKSNMFVMAVGPDGNRKWTRGFVETGSDVMDQHGSAVAVGTNNDVVATGKMVGTIGCTDDKSVVATGGQGDDVFLVKLNGDSGSLAWCKAFGGDGDQEGTDVFVDSNDFIYVTGTFSQSIDFGPDAASHKLTSTGGQNIFVAKLNPAGSVIWTARFGKDEPSGARTVKLGGTSTGQFILGAGWSSGLNFGTPEKLLTHPTGNGLDIFLAKFSE